MSSRPIAIVRSERDLPPWAGAVNAAPTLVTALPLSEPVRAAAREALCALVDGTAPASVETARQLHAVDTALQVALVAPHPEHTRIRREVMFTPGLGEVWVVSPEEVAPGLVERASNVTRQRREYRATRARLEHDLAGIEPQSARRAVISDAYLAALLAVLPTPVLSIDEDGRILSWSAAAEEVLGYSHAEAMGKHVSRLLVLDDPETFSRLLANPALPARGEFRFRRKEGSPGIALIAVAPVEVSSYSVRAVFLQDLTEERQARAEREAQAAELELQAEELKRQAARLRDSQLELEAANAELERTNEELVARTAEAERARAAAEESRLEAEAANRAKSDFLATMSHEIRTPINAIIGYTDLLELGIAGPVTDAQKTQLARIKTSSQHLIGLVEDVLDLAKVEAGRMSIEHKRAMAGDSVAAALALVGPLAAQRGLEIQDRCDDDDPSYVGDEDRVRQILVNLVSNAIKFTDPGGRITISYGITHEPDPDAELLNDGPWTFIRVADTGIGIAPELVERIFHAFEQAESGETRTRGGTGLGLTISRELARLMGGDLTVESEPGKGSTFTLWLPSETAILAPIGELVLAEMHEATERPGGLAVAGKALQTEAGSILDRYTGRIRELPIPMGISVGEADLQDHAVALLADLGQTLIALENSSADREGLLRDGGEIQRVIADLHGSQRAQLGWTEEALLRELEILEEEVEAEVVRSVPEGTDVPAILRIVERFLERARRVSMAAWRRSVGRGQAG